MEIAELAQELRNRYEHARRNEATCQVILFGILYARELQTCGVPLREILEQSGVSRGYLSEISKGIKLSKYVIPREGENHGRN